MEIRMVKFEDGRYGVRRESGFLFPSYTFLDLTNGRHWWSKTSMYFKDCKGDRGLAGIRFRDLKDIGEPV